MNQAALPRDEVSRLRWRGRRGLLECDLFVQRFFDAHGDQMTRRQAEGFAELMALDDPTLLDLLLKRSEPAETLDRADVRDVLNLMRVN